MEAEIPSAVKTCPNCGEEFEALGRRKRAIYCSGRCRATAWARKDRVANREKYRLASRKYHKENREKSIATSRRWKEENKERNAQKHREWCQDNKDKCREYSLKQYWKDPEKQIVAAIAWARKNKKRLAAYKRKHYEENKGYYIANAKRRARIVRRATPKWITEDQIQEIREIYQAASGLGLHVDHIVPLQGKNVCGLHIPENLQLLPGGVNRAKSNKHEPMSL